MTSLTHGQHSSAAPGGQPPAPATVPAGPAVSAGHSPCPWRTVERVGGNPSVIASDGRAVCSTGNGTRPLVQRWADAKLIALAPTMRTLLRRTRVHSRDFPPELCAAIDKVIMATGGYP